MLCYFQMLARIRNAVRMQSVWPLDTRVNVNANQVMLELLTVKKVVGYERLRAHVELIVPLISTATKEFVKVIT